MDFFCFFDGKLGTQFLFWIGSLATGTEEAKTTDLTSPLRKCKNEQPQGAHGS